MIKIKSDERASKINPREIQEEIRNKVVIERKKEGVKAIAPSFISRYRAILHLLINSHVTILE